MTKLLNTNQFHHESFMDNNKISLKEHIKTMLFCNINEIFKRDITENSISVKTKIITVLGSVFMSIQLASLLWKSNTNISDWSKYSLFWRILSYSRLDFLFGYLNLIQCGLFLVNSLMLVIFLLFAFCQLLINQEKEIYYLLKVLANKTIQITSTIFFLPIVMMLIIDIKYFFINENIEEYLVSNESYNNSLSLFRSITSLFVFLFANVIYDNFAIEIRHIAIKRIIDAQANGYINRTMKYTHLLLSILYVSMYNLHPLFFQIVFFSISAYNASKFLYNFPYYSIYMNKVKIICISLEVIISLFFIIGTIIDNSGVILLLSIFITPCWCVLTHSFVDYQYSRIKLSQNRNNNPVILELLLRDELNNDQNQNTEILTKFDKCIIENHYNDCEFLSIYETYYCFYIINDLRISFIKLSKYWKCPYSIQADFQSYVCNKRLNSISLSGYEDLNYIKYISELELIRKKDMNVALSLLHFWAELISAGNIHKLDTFVEQISKGLIEVKYGYEKLIDNFPATVKCKKEFKSFLNEMCLEEPIKDIMIDKNNSWRQYNDFADIKYFDEANGIIIVSGNEANVGEIVYSNERISEMLDESINTIIGSNISVFIPSLYSKKHNQNLLKFSNFCTDSKIYSSTNLFLETRKGFLIECTIKIRCCAINQNIFYLALIKSVNFNRSIILYNKEGVIFSYNSQLIDLIGVSNAKLLLIQDIFEFDVFELNFNTIYTRNFHTNTINLIRTRKYIARTEIEMLLIYEDSTEIDKWDQQNENSPSNKNKVIKKRHETTMIIKSSKKNSDSAKSKNPEDSEIMTSKKNNFSVSSEKNIICEENKLNEDIVKTNQLSNLNEIISKKILHQALRGIYIYKWILLIFV